MIKKVSKIQQEKNKIKNNQKKEMVDLFLSIWDERANEDGDCYCFETGTKLPREIYKNRTICYHHVLSKNDRAYPQYMLTKKNIIILHPNIHAKVENSIDSCPNIKKYREELIDLHDKGNLN